MTEEQNENEEIRHDEVKQEATQNDEVAVVTLEEVDYSVYSKAELCEKLKELVQLHDFKLTDSHVKQIHEFFIAQVGKEEQTALDKYIEEGGEKESFEYKGEEVDQQFFELYDIYDKEKRQFFRDLEHQKQDNLTKKQQLLEELRGIVDDAPAGSSIKKVKAIQEEWKKTGPVPSLQNKELWSSYKALLDRYYDQRRILFELKELDRKKNLEKKIGLCEKAEKMVEEQNATMSEINKLHEEFKAIGAIPDEEQENIWNRFKTASDKLYEVKKQFSEVYKEQLDKNLNEKSELIDKIKVYSTVDSDRIDDWKKWADELKTLQEEWKKAGPAPNDKAKQITKEFWGHSKKFFKNKSRFFNRLEQEKRGNLEKKEALCVEVEELYAKLSDGLDIADAANQVKEIQRAWKGIGPAPRKVNDEIFARFKGLCDKFFDIRRDQFQEQEKEYEVNLDEKKKLVAEIASKKTGTVDEINDFLEKWDSIGFVPKSSMNSIKDAFTEAIKQYVARLELDEENKEQVILQVEVELIKAGSGSSTAIDKQKQQIRKQISSLENEISTLKTNIEFFANSKNADQLRKEIDAKVDTAEEELTSLKKKLKIMREV